MKRVGSTRRKLAEILSAKFGAPFRAEDIWQQYPVYVRWWGCALWGAVSYHPGGSTHLSVASWDTMTNCVKHGIVYTRYSALDIEVSVDDSKTRGNIPQPSQAHEGDYDRRTTHDH